VLVSSILRWHSGQRLHASLDIFFAHEYPELLVRDVKIYVWESGGAYGVVWGKDGHDTGDTARL
jgi:hypothetical protein